MSKKIRAVLDTNILISAIIIDKGKSRKILDYGLDEEFIIVINDDLINEFKEVASRDRIKKKYKLTPEKTERFLSDLIKIAEVTEGYYDIDKFSDKKDNPLLACGLEGEVDYIITGDKELLNLKNVMGIQITAVRDFLTILKK